MEMGLDMVFRLVVMMEALLGVEETSNGSLTWGVAKLRGKSRLK
jgi:hypothetical protein